MSEDPQPAQAPTPADLRRAVGPAASVPAAGVGVEDALEALAEAEGLPLSERAAAFEEFHEALTAALETEPGAGE
ncbi:hypothetical protein [Sinomonas mesophila]|uniref:hypothetical protein n=1 Tax=Sinomonas mesophila TaxID=1531955 RepID=UPI00111577F8|nr:hypothetical protein [Sinomonas mesophila]